MYFYRDNEIKMQQTQHALQMVCAQTISLNDTNIGLLFQNALSLLHQFLEFTYLN